MEKSKNGLEPMTDLQIYNLAKEEWIGVLKQLWEAVGKPINKEQLKVYAKQLADIPLGVLEEIIQELLRNHQYSNVPTIGEIWQTIRRKYGCDPSELKNTYRQDDSWLYDFGEHLPENDPYVLPVTMETMTGSAVSVRA